MYGSPPWRWGRCRPWRIRSALSASRRALLLVCDEFFDDGLALGPFGGIGRQKDDAGSKFARRGQVGVQLLLDHAGEEFVRQRGEDARAVAGVRFAAAGAAVVHVAEHFLGVDQDLMAPLAFDVRDKAHAARIVFVRGIVEPLLRRQRCKWPACVFLF